MSFILLRGHCVLGIRDLFLPLHLTFRDCFRHPGCLPCDRGGHRLGAQVQESLVDERDTREQAQAEAGYVSK